MKNWIFSLLNNKRILTFACVILLVLVVVVGSYHSFSSITVSNNYNVLKSGTFDVSYFANDDNGYGDVLGLVGAYPISDADGLKLDTYKFSVTNNNESSYYVIKLVDDNSIIESDGCLNNQTDKNYIKYKLDNNVPSILGSSATNGYAIYKGHLDTGSTNIHSISVWISENSPSSVVGTHFHGRIVIEKVNQ